MTLKELSAEFFKLKMARHPGVPLHALPRYSFTDKTAAALQKAILAWCEVKGIVAWRQNTTGRYLPGKSVTNVIGRTVSLPGRWLPAAGGVGAGDITAILPQGRYCSIEVKVGRDRIRASQEEFQAKIEANGGIYLVVTSFSEFTFKMGQIFP